MDQFIPLPKARPSTLLVVLCILSILSGLFRAGSGTVSLSQADKFNTMKTEGEKSGKEATKPQGAKHKESAMEQRITKEAALLTSPDYLRKNAYITIGTAIITILGAILMLRLNIIGFWIYVAGTVAEVALPLMLFGAGFLTGIGLAINGFFGLIFIVLYAFCLKEMRPAPILQE